MGSIISFFFVISNIYNLSLLPLILVLILLSGLLGSARLYLKAHNSKELLVGFLIGILSQFAIFFILQ